MLEGGRSMIRRFRSKIGVFLVFGYSGLCLLTVLALIISSPDSMSILALIVITLPWSLLFLELVSPSLGTTSESIAAGVGPVLFVLIFVVSAAINLTFLYFVGWVLTLVIERVGKSGKNSNTG